MSLKEFALRQIEFARGYTLPLLDATPEKDWYVIPPAGVSHVAWQVGHLATSQYRLCLARCRGVRPEDEAVLPAVYIELFGRLSAADTAPADAPSPAELRAVFDRVHAQVMAEVPRFADADLAGLIADSHRFCKTKLDCLVWCPAHEMLHAGQIGLLRRQLGYAPIW